LAVTDAHADFIGAARGGGGELRIDDRCVLLVDMPGPRMVTLVFRQEQAFWRGESNDILFRDPFRGELALGNGAMIEVGGVSLVSPDSPAPSATRGWVAEPDPTCPAELFEVHLITPRTGGSSGDLSGLGD